MQADGSINPRIITFSVSSWAELDNSPRSRAALSRNHAIQRRKRLILPLMCDQSALISLSAISTALFRMTSVVVFIFILFSRHVSVILLFTDNFFCFFASLSIFCRHGVASRVGGKSRGIFEQNGPNGSRFSAAARINGKIECVHHGRNLEYTASHSTIWLKQFHCVGFYGWI